MTEPRCAPDGSARPVRIARAAKDHPGHLSLACSQAEGGDHEVTCLAHLDSETLAAAAVRSGRLTLTRGDCAACPLAIRAPGANGVLHHVDDPPGRIDLTVSRAASLLQRSGVSAPIDVEVRPAHEGDDAAPAAAGGISRRDLLFSVRRDEPDEEEGLTVPAPTPQRGVLLAALPTAMVEHPVASPGCTGCRICEQICPEKAFGWSGVGGNGLLWVTPADCTACGMCVQACPEDVLSLDAVTPADSVHQLARIQPRGCSRCGRGLLPGEEGTCISCRSRRSLLDDVWKHLG